MERIKNHGENGKPKLKHGGGPGNPAPAVMRASSSGPGLCCSQVVLLGIASVGGKARRLKQAKEEAQMEVEQYRREREQEFQSKQQAAMGSQGNLSAEVEQATRRQVQGMQSSQQRNREHVLAQLLGMRLYDPGKGNGDLV
ncbi:V-type proton ATPase subunit G 2 isoform X2 [Hyaena hyaena]|uniref:V-type proton ATPase subunit G 2 isoform X2 n=1 Tax=Hyaena hyaena TaxID=95912 RepID=UPI00192091D6|nr:V-type proton ATPase subunit G 2 isoform X2 [Hyaena hyaena]